MCLCFCLASRVERRERNAELREVRREGKVCVCVCGVCVRARVCVCVCALDDDVHVA